MKKHIYFYRDKTKICVYNYFRLKNMRLLKKNFKFNNTLRQRIIIKNFRINSKFNLNKLKKYCILTGRLRFIIKNKKYSRMVLRELTSKGYIFGMFKK